MYVVYMWIRCGVCEIKEIIRLYSSFERISTEKIPKYVYFKPILWPHNLLTFAQFAPTAHATLHWSAKVSSARVEVAWQTKNTTHNALCLRRHPTTIEQRHHIARHPFLFLCMVFPVLGLNVCVVWFRAPPLYPIYSIYRSSIVVELVSNVDVIDRARLVRALCAQYGHIYGKCVL